MSVNFLKEFGKMVGALIFALPKFKKTSGSSSVGRARPCQGRGRESESRLPLIENSRPCGLEFLFVADLVIP